MTVTLEYSQTKAVDEGPLYKVTTIVEYVHDIQEAIFVHRTETDVFEYVATVWDMDNLPETRAEAVEEGIYFYRSKVAVKSYASIETADEFALYTRGRINTLVNEYSTASGAYPGTARYVITE